MSDNRRCAMAGCAEIVRPGWSFCIRHWGEIRERKRSWHWQLEQVLAKLQMEAP